MAYSTGKMNKRVTIATRIDDKDSGFGDNDVKYTILGDFWAAEDFNRGIKSLREGAFDAYDTVMFRMRFNRNIDRWCLIKYLGKWYQIESLNESYQDNQIQITAKERTDQRVPLVYPPSSASISGGDNYQHEVGGNYQQ